MELPLSCLRNVCWRGCLNNVLLMWLIRVELRGTTWNHVMVVKYLVSILCVCLMSTLLCFAGATRCAFSTSKRCTYDTVLILDFVWNIPILWWPSWYVVPPVIGLCAHQPTFDKTVDRGCQDVRTSLLNCNWWSTSPYRGKLNVNSASATPLSPECYAQWHSFLKYEWKWVKHLGYAVVDHAR